MARIGAGHLAFAAVGLAVGLGLGGLGPREELRVARTETREARSSGGGAGREIARIFQGRPLPAEADAAPEAAPMATEAAPDEGADEPADEGRAVIVEDGDTMEGMRQAMALREQLARAALLEDADPSAEQLQEIDAVFADMNADLRALATEFVDRFKEGEPERRDMMAFAADSLDVLIDTEDRLTEALSEEQRADLSEESLDPLSYVDPSLVDLLGEIDR